MLGIYLTLPHLNNKNDPNFQRPPNQSTPNAQRNYSYQPPGPPGPPYQPTQQPQQHSSAVLQHGLSTHNASQFSNFNPYSNNSRMNNDLRGGYGAHLGSHQPQQPQPTHIQQSWPTNKNTWSTDLGASGSTNSTTNHSSMLTNSIYGSNGQSGSNTGTFAQTASPSLIQQQTMANRLSGDSHAFPTTLMRGMATIGLNNVGFQRPTMSVNDPTNISTFVEVDTTSNEIDPESLIDNSLVTSSSLPSNTPSSTSPNTSISSITDSSSGHSSSASVNNSTNKRSSADSSNIMNFYLQMLDYTTSPHLQPQHMHPNQTNNSISSPRLQKSNSKKSSGMSNQVMPPPQQLHSQTSQIQQQAQQTPSPMHQHNQMHQQQNQSQQQMRHQPPIHHQQQQLQQPSPQQQTPQLQQLQHGQPIQQHHLPQQTQQTSDSQIQMQHTTPKPMGRVINQQQQPSSFPPTNIQNTPKSAKITPNNSDIPTGLPPQKEHKPKRPMNAFIIFSSERRPELQKNDPNMQTAQVSKILGEEWQNMDPARKDHYNARARQLKEDFKQSNPDFVYTRRGSSNSAKKRPIAPPITTVSSSSNNKPQPDPIAVPPQSSNMPMQNDSLNGVVPPQHASNTYTSSPHQHPSSSTPQRNSPAINPIGTSSSSTSTSTPTTTPNRKDNKLKRPMNAFLIFNKEMRPKVLEMNPNMTVAEISKTIGENWRGMTEEQRDQYLQKARELKNEFHETHPDFVYTRRSKAELAAAGHHSYSKKRSPAHSPLKDPRGRKKKRSRHPTAPKHPMSGFLFYALEMRPHVAEQNPGSTVGPISKIIASHWKNLTPEQRERWEKMASDDKARYAREMETYLQDQKENE
ncbi:5748_t:CDS:10 [Diversispora eburnea]|uniref:5748_t:CDS:1 n=2 Tax=Diversisporales TaxID=214509 RepID=A0A9N8YNC2_9GLOM|nr:5748_t:CDS:10 [Diversispora eburnea]